MREVIYTDKAPTSNFYSQGIKIGGHIYVTGLVGIDVNTGQVVGPGIEEQTRQALRNCQAVLEAGGATFGDVVEVGVLLAEPDDFAGMNAEYGKWFPTDPPTRYTTRLGPVIPGVLISIRMVAIVES